MKEDYPTTFSPFTLRRMTVRNRIVMCPMGSNLAKASGEISDDHISYYAQRAKGGTGMLILENVCIDYPMASNGTSQLRIDQDCFMPALYRLTDTVHKWGAKMSVQLNHAGAATMQSRIGHQPISASDVPSKPGGEVPRPMTRDEIMHVVEKFGEAARRAIACGFDCVEIHGGHSYLLSQFLSPVTNHRTDEFGGSPENRARFARLVTEEVRRAVGPHVPILMRICGDEFTEGGNTLDDTIAYLPYLPEVDLFDVSAGLAGAISKQIDMDFYPDGWRSYMARAVREATGKPTMTMGNFRSPAAVERALATGDADLVGMGRGLIAEPQWCRKVAEGREDDLRKCISCNIGCAGHRIGLNQPIRCTVNPDLIHNDEYRSRTVAKPCNVVVVGGGTAGAEAACTAAEVGCTTVLIEKEDRIGGLNRRIAAIPEKARMRDFPTYLEHRAAKLHNLAVLTGTEATVPLVAAFKPDIVVNATGAHPLELPIPGLKELVDAPGGRVSSAFRMLDEIDSYPDDMTGSRVVVIGGAATGMDMMGFFGARGAEVTVADLAPAFGMQLDPCSKNDVAEKLDRYHVRKLYHTGLAEVRPHSFVVTMPDGTTEELPFDYGFVAMGMRSYNPLLADLEERFAGTGTVVYNIGDSLRARQIIHGTEEGRNILRVLEAQGFLPA